MDNIVPDFPLINKSFNLAYSGHDLYVEDPQADFARRHPHRAGAGLANRRARKSSASTARALDILGQALTIRQVDPGSCNGCELEIHALSNPYYNLEGLGIGSCEPPPCGPAAGDRTGIAQHGAGAEAHVRRDPRAQARGRRGRLRLRRRNLRRKLRHVRRCREGHSRGRFRARVPAAAARILRGILTAGLRAAAPGRRPPSGLPERPAGGTPFSVQPRWCWCGWTWRCRAARRAPAAIIEGMLTTVSGASARRSSGASR